MENTSVVSLTANAVKKIKELSAQDAESKGKALRICLEAGGCSGYQYGFRYDDKKAGDHVVSADGIEVVIDAQSGQMMQGSVIDYKEDFAGEGFAVENPNVKRSCGCGNSVEV